MFPQKWTFGVCIWTVLMSIALTEATITIVETGERISSHTSKHVGARFRVGFEYMARLQYFPENLELCSEESPSPLRHNFTITVPSDGLPVALLASQGGCSDFAKSRFAAFDVLPSNVAKYLIIYDESDHRHRHGFHSTDEEIEASLRQDTLSDDVDIKVLYVSHKNGMELLHAAASPNVESAGGPRILLDGRSSTPLAKNVIFWMGLSLVLSACFCSFLLSVQVHRLNEEAETDGETARAPRRRLTLEEVETLIPEIEYNGSNTNQSLMSLAARASEEKEGHGDSLTCTPPESGQMSASPYVLLPHQDDCSICLDDYVQGDKMRTLPCGHGFHSACITKWLTERSSTCPLCKAILERVEESDDDSSFSSAGSLVEIQEGGPDEEEGTASPTLNDMYQSLTSSLAQARRRHSRWWQRRRSRRLSEQQENNESDEAISLSRQPLLLETSEQPFVETVEAS